MEQIIYHIVSSQNWDGQETSTDYEAESLQTEGFIHLSRKEQVNGVLNRYYQHIPDLLLLRVDSAKLTHELRYEASTNNELFPHLYGPLNKDAIVEIEKISYAG